MEEAKDSIVFCYISSNFQLNFMDWLWFAFFTGDLAYTCIGSCPLKPHLPILDFFFFFFGLSFDLV